MALLLLAGGWFSAQHDNFNPAERDISDSLMEAGSMEDLLYRTPLQRWTDPAVAHAESVPATDLGIFPPTILEGGWQAATRVQEFDESNVYEKIDGAADQYMQYGFKYLHFIGLEHSQAANSLNIELYDMGGFPNALGIFNTQRSAERQIEQVEGAYFYLTEAGAIGITGPYYFKFTGDENAPAMVEKGRQLVAQMSKLVQGQVSVPAAFAVLQDKLNVPVDGIAFESSDVFQYGFAKDFWFGKPDPRGDMRYFVHEAADEAVGKDLFGQLRENLLADYSEVQNADTRVVLKHQFLGNYFVLERHGATVYGVENIPQADQVEGLVATFQAAFFDDAA
ncbi:MAG: hypothetical protein HYV26_24720 [Candidatus Hydrogenedentes bacterium]|nr:hypothetical protein [Candidatus Hydrogenedentota bacterium]